MTGPAAADPAPVIELKAAAHTYAGPPPVQALHATNLRINHGEHVAIIGPSGSGKSTLLNVLGLLDRPTSGRYLLDGIDVADLSEGARTTLRGQRIGFVFQAFHLLPYRSAMENVELALLYRRTDSRHRALAAQEALETVGLSHRRLAVPTAMSGGERQRVAVARAIVGAPSLLLCDEPTGNLDTTTAAALLDLLDRLHHQGRTILVITHDPTVAARAHRLIEIRDGHLRELEHAAPI